MMLNKKQAISFWIFSLIIVILAYFSRVMLIFGFIFYFVLSVILTFMEG